MTLTREIVKWGNSLGLRIPNEIFRVTHFKEGDNVSFEIIDENTLQLRKHESPDS